MSRATSVTTSLDISQITGLATATLTVSKIKAGDAEIDHITELTGGHGIAAAVNITGNLTGNADTATSATAVNGLTGNSGTDSWVGNDAEIIFSDAVYTKKKTIQLPGVLPYVGGSLKISFDIKSSGLGVNICYGKIYKNGVAVGTERSNNTDTYVTFTETLTFAAGDTIQFYGKSDAGNVYVRNFRIVGTLGAVTLSNGFLPTTSTP